MIGRYIFDPTPEGFLLDQLVNKLYLLVGSQADLPGPCQGQGTFGKTVDGDVTHLSKIR